MLRLAASSAHGGEASDRPPRHNDYERLAQTAEQLGMRPGTLANVLLHASLAGARTASLGNRARALAALARLREVAAGLPPVDAVALAAEARRELDARASR